VRLRRGGRSVGRCEQLLLAVCPARIRQLDAATPTLALSTVTRRLDDVTAVTSRRFRSAARQQHTSVRSATLVRSCRGAAADAAAGGGRPRDSRGTSTSPATTTMPGCGRAAAASAGSVC